MEALARERRAPDLRGWRTALDPPSTPHREAWATLDLLSALWQPGQAASLLTPSGVPLEFTFRSDSDTLVYTAEPGSSTYSPHTKWSVIRAITATDQMEYPSSVGAAPRGRLDGPMTNVMARDQGGHGGPPLPVLVDMLRQQPGQRFGCWLGVRQGMGVASYKVYQEVTPAARQHTRDALDRLVPGLDRSIPLVPQLVGQSLPAGAIEFYLRIPDPRPATLHALLGAIGAAGQLRLCRESLAGLADLPLSQLHERIRLGLSYRLAPDQPPVVSLFLHSVQISEHDRSVRTRLLELAAQLGLDFARYARATVFLHDLAPPLPFHGLIGLSVAPTGRLSLSAGVSPPSHPWSCHT